MRGVISTDTNDVQALVERAKKCPQLSGQELVPTVATTESYTYPGQRHRVVLIDFGAKRNIIRCLQERGCEVVVVPYNITSQEALALNPAGVVLSNGPGDPTDVPYAIKTARELVGQVPVLGICLGHQILGLAMGGRTYKMKFGHRGANHPVKDLITGRVYISSHNHGFSVDEESLKGLDVMVSHRNLNDGTVEGLRHKYLPVFSVQYHPEASPGPKDSEYIFDQFIDIMAGKEA
jgi:carbamoyl-phosphate synthase small subunit